MITHHIVLRTKQELNVLLNMDAHLIKAFVRKLSKFAAWDQDEELQAKTEPRDMTYIVQIRCMIIQLSVFKAFYLASLETKTREEMK